MQPSFELIIIRSECISLHKFHGEILQGELRLGL